MVLVASLLLPAGMLAQDVNYNFASDVDFSKFKTYKWVQIPGAEKLNQLADEQLRGAVDVELAKKGLMLVTTDPADLFIGYQVGVNQEKQVTSFDSGWGYGPGWRYGYGGGGITTSTTSTIQIGQVDLDMYDAAGKRLVWRGSASKTLDTNASPEKRKKNLAKGVAKLLKKYPPPVKKS
jgi:hypothetical protein